MKGKSKTMINKKVELAKYYTYDGLIRKHDYKTEEAKAWFKRPAYGVKNTNEDDKTMDRRRNPIP